MGERTLLYARQAQLGLAAQIAAAELKLRAERRAGELWPGWPNKHPAGRPPGNRSQRVTDDSPPRLNELGISKRQSSRWQQIAAVPEPVFEERIATTRSRRQELTTAGALKLARSYRPPHMPTTILTPMHDQLDQRDRFDIADAARVALAGRGGRPHRHVATPTVLRRRTSKVATCPTMRPG